MKFYLLNVFTKDNKNGNQLAAVLPTSELSDEQMQSIAREFNFSETIFITEKEAHPLVRIFTPTSELPFAGHPTVGAAWLLNHLGKTFERMEVKQGMIRAKATAESGEVVFPGMGEMAPYTGNLAELLKQTGLSETDVMHRLVKNVTAGPEFTIIPVKNRDVLTRAHLPASLNESLRVYYFFPESDSSYHVRMFSTVGNKEDAATGSAACALAVYLKNFMQVPKGKVTVHQGLEMGRPCAIQLEWEDTIQIGGNVSLWGEGELKGL